MVQEGQRRKRSLSLILDGPHIRIRKNLAAVGIAITATDVSPGTKFGLSGDRQRSPNQHFRDRQRLLNAPASPNAHI